LPTRDDFADDGRHDRGPDLLLLVLLLAAPHTEAQPSCKVSKIGVIVMLTQVIQ